jgi:hypothetical protein
MKKKILIFILIFEVHSFLLSNPIDDTPFTCFSELVFDDNNIWTMELLFPFGNPADGIDSVIIESSESRAKLKNIFPEIDFSLIVINSDSLSNPLTINRNGDTIRIYTYSNLFSQQVRISGIIFGYCPGADVGQPMSGYSIYRIGSEYFENGWYVDCLTKNPSLGFLNSVDGQYGTMQGKIYEKDGKLINKLGLLVPVGYPYLVLESQLIIDSSGTYTTMIFNKIYKPGLLNAYAAEWPAWNITIKIDSFELKDIHPDTLVIQDIHLREGCSFCQVMDAVEREEYLQVSELTLINYPNPFNSSTNFFVKIPDRLKDKPGQIEVYNINGQLIRTIPVKGSGTVKWDGKNMTGSTMPSGIYYYRLNIDKHVMKNGSMILLK